MRRKARSFLPSTAVIELTYSCNHQCIYCSCPWYADGRGFDRLEELPADRWRNIVSMLCDLGVANIALTGGEALLRDDALEILEHASNCRVEHLKTVGDRIESRVGPPNLYLLSNGVLVDDRVLMFCLRNNVKLSMSLPGLSTFEYHTGFNHADMVLSLFGAARELGIATTANITVTSKNLFEFRKTISAALLAGAGQVLLNRFLPGGRGLGRKHDLSLTAEQVREMLLIADSVLKKSGRFGSMGTELPLCITNDLDLETLRVSTRCAAAVGFFVIGPSGYVRVCNHSEKRLAHIDNWQDLKTHDYWKKFVMKRYLPEECGDCSLRLNCDAGCREAAFIAGGGGKQGRW